MKINWVVANLAQLDPTVDIESFKQVGPIWGGWQTWRAYNTDNVICVDYDRAVDLIRRTFHKNCNFYLPQDVYSRLENPPGIKSFQGSFQQEVDFKEELIAMHLAAGQSDIVLLLGFDWTEKPVPVDRLLLHRAHNYKQLVKHAITGNSNAQWVLVDHPGPVMNELSKITNLTQDSLPNVQKLLGLDI